MRVGPYRRLSTEVLMLSNCNVGKNSLRVPWTARRSNQPILRKSSLNIHGEDRCWSSNTLATWCKEVTHWKRSWCWERLRAWGQGGNREWNGWMASLTQWTWIWANSGRLWRRGKPDVLQSVELQSVRCELATEQKQQPFFKNVKETGYFNVWN